MHRFTATHTYNQHSDPKKERRWERGKKKKKKRDGEDRLGKGAGIEFGAEEGHRLGEARFSDGEERLLVVLRLLLLLLLLWGERIEVALWWLDTCLLCDELSVFCVAVAKGANVTECIDAVSIARSEQAR